MSDDDYCRRHYERSKREQDERTRANQQHWFYMNGRDADDLSAADYHYGES